jgi:hypothetical protein
MLLVEKPPVELPPVDNAENDGVLGKVDDLVDEVFGTDLLGTEIAPTEAEDPWQRRQRILDSWTAIILAIAAVATTWSSFQASQWSNAQSDAQSASAIQRSDANRAASEATSQSVVDSEMWISWVEATAAQQKLRAGFLRDRFSPTLDRAQKEWLGRVAVDADGNPAAVPDGTPLDLPVYVVPAQVQADALSAKAEDSLSLADEASNNATRHVMLAVLFALVLFFASVATKFTAPKIQVALILVSLLLLGTTCVRMLMLPQML